MPESLRAKVQYAAAGIVHILVTMMTRVWYARLYTAAPSGDAPFLMRLLFGLEDLLLESSKTFKLQIFE